MSYTATYPHAPAGTHHPVTAAALSLCPGLGHLYIGQWRKGFLFLHASFVNAFILALVINADRLAHLANVAAEQSHIRVNVELTRVLHNLHPGSPASLLFLCMAAAFVWYAARDAYDAAILQRRPIYRSSLIELSEATSGSYIAHAAAILAFAIMALFFVFPPKHTTQVIEITFADTDVSNTKVPVKTDIASAHTTDSHGPKDMPKRNTTEHPSAPASNQAQPAHEHPSAPASHQAQPAHDSRSSSAPQPRITEAAPPVVQPQPVMRRQQPLPAPTPITAPSMTIAKTAMVPSPRPAAVVNPTPAPALPVPAAPKTLIAMAPPVPAGLPPSSIAGINLPPAPVAKVAPSSGTSALPWQAPIAIAGSTPRGGYILPDAIVGANSASRIAGAPAPMEPHGNASTAGTTSTPPAPVLISRATGTDSRSGAAIMPVRAATGGQQHQLAALPVVPQGPGIAGLPDEGLRSGGDKPGASTPPTHPVNFAPYMAELQRKIGQHWFPPRDTESRTIIVTFTVDAAGNMSNLTMSRGSGIAFADHAALAAVKDTFPFRPLPDGAPPQVDIEFTFDYNVFTGRPRTF